MNKKVIIAGTMIAATALMTMAPLADVSLAQPAIGTTVKADSKVSDTDQLEYGSITPMETAAAIVYYRQPRMFKESLKMGGMDLHQYNSSHADEPGNGIMFDLVTKNAQEGSFDYTVDHDGEIYFYGAGDQHYGSVNLRKVINKVNNEGAVSKVRALASETDFIH